MLGSLGGLVGLPYHSSYCASKAAVRTVVQSLRGEVAGFGIDVVVIEPGDVNTGTTALRSRLVVGEDGEDDAYGDAPAAARSAMVRGEAEGVSADAVASVVARVLTVRRPRPRYTVAHGMQRLLGPAGRALPETTLLGLVHSFYRQPGRRGR
jgi:short-subunit dehydrogenase